MSPTERPDSLTSGFTARANTSPEAEALSFRGARITYAELRDRSEAMAAVLLNRGVRTGDTVAFRHPRSIDGVVGMLGILRAGAAVLPLPPELPRLRVREILDLAQPAAVVVADALDEDDLPGPRASTVSELERAGRGQPRPSLPEVPPTSPAFMLSTSGSTGRPKLIVRSHRSFFHRLRWTWRTHPYAGDERVCQKSPLTTTHAVYELFEPLLGGVPTVIVDDAEVRDLPAFWARLRTEGVSRLLIVPSMMRTSLDLDGFSPPDLRVVVLMGEAVDGPLAERIVSEFPPPTALYSIYGSTEASSTLIVDLRTDLVDGRLPLGRPISDAVTVEVLDDAGRRVARGTEGRLHVAGTPLFDEYLGDPEATDAVTRVGPAGERLFDSRDRVLLDPEGRLHYRGRVDASVKIRGFTVNTAEVESVLTAAPGVRNAAVLAAPAGEDAGDVVLAAFLSPDDVSEDAARAHCRERLPDYMVPGVLLTLDRLPTLPNGKVDRVALLGRLQGEPEEPAANRGTGTLGQVCSVWETVLGHAY
ncbi:MAG TPA: AMP-binding protein, partial [Longimicrobiales bacterium]|nr:AMP-binding protein [Longimicrobiales bacterium]